MDATPIIIKKRKSHDHPHHGGSWKVAYADFVTAMMAFFMVMWIMGLSDSTRAQIQGYFNDPLAFDKAHSRGKLVIAPPSTPISQPGQAPPQASKPAQDEHKDMKELKGEFEKSLKNSPDLIKYLDHIKFLLTEEGLRIEFIEDRDDFFQSGSAELKPGALKVIQALAPKLAASGRPLSIEGHTDAVPFQGKPWGNLELSTNRALSLAAALGAAGEPAGKCKDVKGFGDSNLRDPQHPTSAVNRRVTILLPFVTPSTATTPMPKDEVKHAMSGNVIPPKIEGVSLGQGKPDILKGK
jgi:chemotaxis protein MotB